MIKRKVIIPLFLLFSFYMGKAQLIMIDSETGEFKYEEIVQEAGMSKDQIRERAQRWLNQYFTSEDSIHLDSTGVTRLCSSKIDWTLIKKKISIEVFFDVNIRFKDGKYKYAFSDFREGI